MKKSLHVFLLALLISISPAQAIAEKGRVAIAVHGGVGTMKPSRATPELERAYREALTVALETGYAVLESGGSGLDAAVATIRVMEDSPLFNAARGAVFNSSGGNEFDAIIMDGDTLDAGAVAAIKGVRNPIELARLVLERSPHVLLVGESAQEWGREQGIVFEDPEYFYTERRWKQLEKARKRAKESGVEFDPFPTQENKTQDKEAAKDFDPSGRFGTVGVVVLDRSGRLTAATSTGGLTNKRWGRVGDTPIIGAGTYADSRTCAVSGTGHGEYFMRYMVAYDICAEMKYQGRSIQVAAESVVMDKLKSAGGNGGVIAMDAQGNIAMVFNTPGMYRGYINIEGKLFTGIYAGE